MAELANISYTLVTSPRIAESPSTVDEVTVQDALDTLSAKQDDIDVIGSTPAIDNTVLVSGSGKDDLGGGVSVGITSTFDNLQWAFASDYTATESGTATSTGTTTLIDTAATFITNGVVRGSVIINYDDRSVTEVLTVDSETQITHRVLNNGVANDWTIGDNYTIHNIVQKNLSGGNQVAIDDVGSSISPVYPTAFTQVILTASSSATLQNQEQLEAGLFLGRVSLDAVSGFSGTGKAPNGAPIGTQQAPSNNITDTILIAIERGIAVIHVLTSFTLSTDSLIDGYILQGKSPAGTQITVDASADVTNCEFWDCIITGTLDGSNILRECIALDLTVDAGNGDFFQECALNGTITLIGGTQIHFWNCNSNFAGSGPTDTAVIDLGGTVGCDLRVSKYTGSMKFINNTDATVKVSTDIQSGRGIIDGTVTAGEFTIRGSGAEIIHTQTGSEVVSDRTGSALNWERTIEGTFTAEEVMRIMSSALAGKATGLDTLTPTFRDINDTKDRIAATTDANGNRLTVVVDET